jgi:hypothetical protein
MSFASSMKYELLFSMAALSNPEHHNTQMAWIQKAKDALPKTVLQRIKDIFGHSHEAILVKMLSGCEDTIEGIAQCLTCLSLKGENEILQVIQSEKDIAEATKLLALLKDTSRGTISNEAKTFFYDELGIRDKDEMVSFSRVFSSPSLYVQRMKETLTCYWDAFFKEEWEGRISQTLKEIIVSLSEQAHNMDILGFLEEQTGKKIGFPRVIIYISCFIAPHAILLEEGGIIVDKTGVESAGLPGIYHSLFHELLHPLLRGLGEGPVLGRHFEALKANAELKELYDETMLGGYGWEGFMEENIVVAFTRFLLVKLGMRDERLFPPLYTGLQKALFDEFVSNYDVAKHRSIEGFLIWLCENKDIANAMLPPEQRSAVLRSLQDSYERL